MGRRRQRRGGAPCFTLDPRAYLEAQPGDIAEFTGYEELREMSLSQLERLAKRFQIPLRGFSRKTIPRKSQLIRALVEFQRRNEVSLRAQMKEIIELDEVMLRLRDQVRSQLEVDQEVARETEGEAGPPDPTEIPAEVLSRLTTGIRRLRRERLRVSREVAKERRRRNAQVEALLSGNRQNLDIGQLRHLMHGAMADVQSDAVIQQLSPGDLDLLVSHMLRHPLLRDESALRRAGATIDFYRFVADGIIPDRATTRLFGRIFGGTVERAIEEHRPLGDRIAYWAGQLWNVPRAAITAFDFSASLRQGMIPFFSHPILGIRLFAEQIRAFSSEAKAREIEQRIKSDPYFEKVTSLAGVFIADLETSVAKMSQREEEFVTDMFDRLSRAHLEGVGKVLTPLQWHAMGVRASERAYITYLNLLRFNLARNLIKQAELEGFDFDNPTPLEVRQAQNIGKFINAATGRGNIRQLSNALINGLIFSPRFVASRIEHPIRAMAALAGRNSPQALRQEAFRQLLATATVYSSVIYLLGIAAAAFGWEDEVKPPQMNPLHPDFLKVNVAGTRIDLGGGYGPVIRTLTALTTGLVRLQGNALRYDYRSGRIVPVEGRGDPEEWWNRLTRELLLFKLSPIPSMIVSIGRGQFIGDRKAVTPARIAKELFVPITFQEVRDTIEAHGWLGTTFLLPELVGLGVQQIGERGAGVDNSLGFIDKALGEAIFDDPRAFNPDRGRPIPLLGHSTPDRTGRSG